MSRSKLIKWIVLANFIFWIGAFLLYRSGYLDSYIFNDNAAYQSSANGGVVNPEDTIPAKKDSLPKIRMSSSKSFVMTDKMPQRKDTVKPKRDSLIRIDSFYFDPMMSGSKSGKVFEWKDKVRLDSFDRARKNKKAPKRKSNQ
ncbi:MAG TPA: hypothetical protein VD993_05645 [Chitinophagaceae bacterium]|nr:hypothetical protein [Chitinophagaceae bacterium]